ncbi:MMPL family transporter [Salirhabdus sp. Marseille-P4669]|uniref:MMPL family transporter n=1 Tax=Salirhabdus sp. Marseille-P4669 TaxID=2042310 RepID=UPI000C7A53A4|nr:MMPL family transporter [Salirhabdus sp. Marseille-P4669]
MRKIIQYRWLVFVLWIAAAVSLLVFAPNLQELVREKGEITVPEGYPSTIAAELESQMSDEGGESTTSAVLVFHNEDGLSEEEKAEVEAAIQLLKDQEAQLGISNILAFTDDARIEEQVVAEDGTTIIVPFSVSLENQTIDEARDTIKESVESINVEHYLTGEAFISQDIIINSEEGLKKTEVITVVFIMIILFIVFKSAVAPFIPLLTVGISYLAAQGVVSILADTVGFPLSTFTQIFMVAVMFGIGTDYCILLISRFKEELANCESTKDAVVATYKSAGKTIAFAGIAVLIGFSTIGLSTFSLYQSAVAVAVGVAVVLIALPTLVPFFLVVLGKKMFWPFDKNIDHKESKIWKAAGTFSWKRPIIALLIVAVITLPSVLFYDGFTSYNSLEEIGDDYETVAGFNIVSERFGPGETMPATVLMKIDEKIDTAKEFQDIEIISQRLADGDGVKAVRSATRPTGDLIEDFTVTNQTGLLSDGIGQSTDGIDQIQSGLEEAAQQISDSQPQLKEAEEGVNQLLTGTEEANNGVGEMQTALQQIQEGIASGSTGAKELRENLILVRDGVQELINFNNELVTSLSEIEQGLKPIVEGYNGYYETLTVALDSLKAVLENNPQLGADQDFMRALGSIDAVVNGTEMEGQKVPSMAEVNGHLTTIQQGLTAAMEEIATQTQDKNPQDLIDGLNGLIAGIEELESGLGQAANGQQQVINNVPSLQDGLTQMYGGQEELKNAFVTMQEQMGELSSGLTEGADGLEQVSSGLSEVQSYLEEFSSEDETSSPMVNIPEEALENEEFMEGIQPYLSEDGTIVKFEVVLEYNPYSTEAKDAIGDIAEIADGAKKNTIFADSETAIGGVSSMNNDLQNISDEDYSRTVVLMLIGIFIMLVILLRSLVMPIYLIGSLILTYFTSMGIAEFIFVNMVGYEGLTWAVPFFAFVMLMALGIDYSIFLMDRFKEYGELSIQEALITAMKNMGTVILSAAIILGGTFAAMLPSGVLSILQIATVVLAGLFLYAFVIIPLFIPIMVKLFGNANWWPFNRN